MWPVFSCWFGTFRWAKPYVIEKITCCWGGVGLSQCRLQSGLFRCHFPYQYAQTYKCRQKFSNTQAGILIFNLNKCKADHIEPVQMGIFSIITTRKSNEFNICQANLKAHNLQLNQLQDKADSNPKVLALRGAKDKSRSRTNNFLRAP